MLDFWELYFLRSKILLWELPFKITIFSYKFIQRLRYIPFPEKNNNPWQQWIYLININIFLWHKKAALYWEPFEIPGYIDSPLGYYQLLTNLVFLYFCISFTLEFHWSILTYFVSWLFLTFCKMICLPRLKNAIRGHYSLTLSKDIALRTCGQA